MTETEPNKFTKFFWEEPKKKQISKWHHYFDIYDRHFKRFQGKNPTILEIGLFDGGSLEMWNYYFGNQCTIIGVDINPEHKKYEEDAPNIKVFIGDQADPGFWNYVKSQIPKVDILIDDGGHHMHQQIATYECMYNYISDNGVYLCEDLHTSYWGEFGGGYKSPHSFIEYSKNFIDLINAYHTRVGTDLTFRKTTNSIHYYDSVLVLEKKVDNVVPMYSIR